MTRITSLIATRIAGLIIALWASLAWVESNPSRLPNEARLYEADFQARFMPASGIVEASITIGQMAGQLRWIDLPTSDRLSRFEGAGRVAAEPGRLRWHVPELGGTLRYRVVIDSAKGDAFDARLTDSWAVLRLGDVFPPARVRTLVGATSRSSLSLSGPEGWSFETRYGAANRQIEFDHPERRFDRPTGWLAAGHLGVRRERIAERRVAVAGPVDQGIRRLDVLAFLHWTLPALVEVFPDLPQRLLIVSARDGMWRGGLSGPGSLYLHADRPLISENATSTLLHELVHVAASMRAIPGDDWIVEGLAEYYSLEILRRSGGISGRRYARALEQLGNWANRDRGRLANPSTGADTARAALLFHSLAAELAAAGASLDAVVIELFQAEVPDRAVLAQAVERALGRTWDPMAPIKAGSAG